jgi:3-deoxy-D-manno-octulosonic-acid transferase
MVLFLYNLFFPVLFLLYLPFFVGKLLRRGNYRHHFGERFGFYSKEQRERLRALNEPVWIHAVSVGEAVAAISFIKTWQLRAPQQKFVLSTTTTTGHLMAEKKLPAGVVLVYCPLDYWPVVGRALTLIRPRMLVIFEVEFWPTLISRAVTRGIPVTLVNGRLSDRSARGYAKHRWFFGPLFSKLSVFCMQSDTDGERVSSVVGSAVPVHVCDTMKFDQIPDCKPGGAAAQLDRFFGPGERVVWTVGSTHPGEEALVADVFAKLKPEFPQLRLVLVPRHTERTAEVEEILRQRDLSYALLNGAGEPAGAVDILLVNTTGELMKFYASADLVYVGKSLAGNQGGHNIIEPAIFGKAILYGHHMENFRHVAAIFRQHGAALELDGDQALAPAMEKLLGSAEAREDLARKSREVVERYRGAINRTIDILEDLSR